jgi:hypothetical protein
MDNYDDNPMPDVDAQQQQRAAYYETLLDFLRDNDGIRAAASGSMKQGLLAGGGAVTGGLLLGPIGGLVGGVVGSVAGLYYAQKHSYRGVLQHIGELEPVERQRLVTAVQQTLLHAGANARSFDSPQQFKTVLLEMADQRVVRDQIWKACIEALE